MGLFGATRSDQWTTSGSRQGLRATCSVSWARAPTCSRTSRAWFQGRTPTASLIRRGVGTTSTHRSSRRTHPRVESAQGLDVQLQAQVRRVCGSHTDDEGAQLHVFAETRDTIGIPLYAMDGTRPTAVLQQGRLGVHCGAAGLRERQLNTAGSIALPVRYRRDLRPLAQTAGPSTAPGRSQRSIGRWPARQGSSWRTPSREARPGAPDADVSGLAQRSRAAAGG